MKKSCLWIPVAVAATANSFAETSEKSAESRRCDVKEVPVAVESMPSSDAELEAVANGTLTTSLRQLASLLTVAEDIFANLTAELAQVAERSGHLRHKLDKVEERLCTVDPKKIPVREYSESFIFFYLFNRIN